MIAFDTNIYVYTLDADSPYKRTKALQLLRSHRNPDAAGPLLWQVFCEFLAFLRRQSTKNRIGDQGIQTEMGNLLRNHALILPHPDAISISIDLTRRYTLSH